MGRVYCRPETSKKLKLIYYDIELVKDVFLIVFKFNCGQYVSYTICDLEDGTKINDLIKLKQFINYVVNNGYYLVSYNGKHFDNVILNYIDRNSVVDLRYLNGICSDIIDLDEITDRVKKYKYNIRFKWIDFMITGNLIKPAPRSLKLAASSAGFYNIEDFSFDVAITNKELLAKLMDYCHNDVEALEFLSQKLMWELEIRIFANEYFGVDVINQDSSGMSNILFPMLYSDKAEIPLKELKQMSTNRHIIKIGELIEPIINYDDPVLKKMLDKISTYSIKGYGKLTLHYPEFVYSNVKYQIGAGGLHTVDKGGIFRESLQKVIVDVDVASYYPNLIVEYHFYPEHLGMTFVEIYESLINMRVKFKYEGKKNEAYVFKIFLNSTFGKMNAEFPNWLKDSQAAISITINGQLMLLVCAEMGTKIGAQIISANTDGLTFIMDRDLIDKFHETMNEWMEKTKLQLEFTRYKTYVRSSVNDYTAESYNIPEQTDPNLTNQMVVDSIKFQKEGDYKLKVKRKGPTLHQSKHKDSFMKVMDRPIIAKAVEEYFLYDRPVEDTVKSEDDLYMFTTCKKIAKSYDVSGFQYDDIDDEGEIEEELGNVLRFYICNNAKGATKAYKTKDVPKTWKNRKSHGNKAEISKGNLIMPCNKIMDSYSRNHPINYDYYIGEAYKIIRKIMKEDKSKFITEEHVQQKLF